MDKVGCDTLCKSHSARSDRDQYRICPTKLSKSELENLYFVLIENNLELKKTINGQQDRIKMLSTKMQRMSSTQRIFRPDGRKDCCVATKAVVNQQKEMIMDLRLANERMADRIRKLNMRLCSAKQFSKSAAARCIRCSISTSPYLIKHSSCSQQQQSQSTIKLAMSCQNLSRNASSTKYTQTPFIPPSDGSESTKKEQKSCEDNRCSSFIDELKQKIDDLQQELSHTQEEYSTRYRKLQQESDESRNEIIRLRSERMAIEHEVQKKDQKTALLLTSLRAAEGLSNELKTELCIEKRRVAELETRLKTTTISNHVTKAIEETLNSIQHSHTELSSKYMNSADETKLSTSADDSGYVDTKSSANLSDDQSLNRIIEELTKRIIVLQTQVDALTISPAIIDKDDYSSAEDNNEAIIDLESPLQIPTFIEHTLLSNSTNESIDTFNLKSKELEKIDDIKKKIKPTKDKLGMANNPQVPNDTKNVNFQKNQAIIKKRTDKIRKTPEINSVINGKSNETNENTNKIYNVDAKSRQVSNVATDNKNLGIQISGIPEAASHTEANNRLIGIASKSSTDSDEKTYTVASKNANNTKDIPESEEGSLDKTYNVSQKEVDINKEVSQKEIDGKYMGTSPKRRLNKIKSLMEKSTKNVIKHKITDKAEHRGHVQAVIEPANTSVREATYTLEEDNENSRANSPDNTDYEISSMSDLSEIEHSPKRLLSPGEHKLSTQTESFTTNKSNYSLSEGEIPTATVRRRSYGDNLRTDIGLEPKMEETLQAINEEIVRCKRLLNSQPSQFSATLK